MYDIHITCEIGVPNIKLKTNFYNYIVSKGNISNFLPMKLEGKLLSVSICNNIDIWMGRVMWQTLARHVLHPQIWLVHLQTNQPIKYVYLILCQLRSGCPRSVGHLDWQMPSKQGSHIQQTSADSHTLQRERWIIFHLVDLAPEPEYTIYQTALMHEWTMNHNSLKKGSYTVSPAVQDTFQAIPGLTSCTEVTGDGGCYPMQDMQASSHFPFIASNRPLDECNRPLSVMM